MSISLVLRIDAIPINIHTSTDFPTKSLENIATYKFCHSCNICGLSHNTLQLARDRFKYVSEQD